MQTRQWFEECWCTLLRFLKSCKPFNHTRNTNLSSVTAISAAMLLRVSLTVRVCRECDIVRCWGISMGCKSSWVRHGVVWSSRNNCASTQVTVSTNCSVSVNWIGWRWEHLLWVYGSVSGPGKCKRWSACVVMGHRCWWVRQISTICHT